MTDTVYGRAAEGLSRFRVHEVRDRRALDEMLSDDRAYAAYALGHLEVGLFERSRFWTAEGPASSAVVLHANAMGRTMFVGGDPVGVDAILSLHPGPRASYLTTCRPEHRAVLDRTHVVFDTLHMIRMSITSATFAPTDGAVQPLRGSDARALNALYALEGAPGYYTAEHVESGVYYGAFEGSQLVSVAGTHVVAPHTSVGVVGNVFTHPAHRGRGLATRVTSRVTGELFDRGCVFVALTVDPTNTPAVRAYSRLGYVRGPDVIEARVRRRARIGLGAWLRRRAARRSRNQFGEIEEQVLGRPLDDDEAEKGPPAE